MKQHLFWSVRDNQIAIINSRTLPSKWIWLPKIRCHLVAYKNMKPIWRLIVNGAFKTFYQSSCIIYSGVLKKYLELSGFLKNLQKFLQLFVVTFWKALSVLCQLYAWQVFRMECFFSINRIIHPVRAATVLNSLVPFSVKLNDTRFLFSISCRLCWLTCGNILGTRKTFF